MENEVCETNTQEKSTIGQTNSKWLKDLDKADLGPHETQELDKAVKVLNDNPAMSIELHSHTDCKAPDGYKRAYRSIKHYTRLKIN